MSRFSFKNDDLIAFSTVYFPQTTKKDQLFNDFFLGCLLTKTKCQSSTFSDDFFLLTKNNEQGILLMIKSDIPLNCPIEIY